MSVDIRNIEINKNKDGYTLIIDLEDVYTQGGQPMRERGYYEVKVDPVGIHLKSTKSIEGGLSIAEARSLIKALSMAIDFENYELKIL